MGEVKIDTDKIEHALNRGVKSQFEFYSFSDMIDDLDLTEEERKYANENYEPGVRFVP